MALIVSGTRNDVDNQAVVHSARLSGDIEKLGMLVTFSVACLWTLRKKS